MPGPISQDAPTTRVGDEAGAAVEERTAPTRGSTVGRYVILDRIGKGGMGEVFAAYDPELDRRVALKLIAVGSRRGARAQERLLREAQALARLSHPAVVTVFDAGTHGERVFVAMERLEGPTLATWLARQPRPWRRVLAVLIQAGEGLAAAHARDLVHRDFKPANVMVCPGDRAVVLDFGLARRLESPSDSDGAELPPLEREGAEVVRPVDLTETGIVLGTPAYMAPEQFFDRTVDARTDQFAFCVVAFRALFGVAPFRGQTFEELRRAISDGKREPVPSGTKVPRRVRAAIERGLALDRNLRYASMLDLLRELGHGLGSRRRRATAAAVVISICGVGGGAVWIGAARARPCVGLEAQAERAWSPGRAVALEQAMTANELPYAADAFERVQPALDEYVRAWASARADACEATMVRGEQSERLMDLRVACLDHHLQRLGAVVDVLQTADPDVVENALDAVANLPPVARCSDPRALLDEVAPPEDPAIAAEVEAIRSELATAAAHAAAGQHEVSYMSLPALLERARATGHLPVVAEVARQVGVDLEQFGRIDEAVAHFEESLWASIEAGDAMAEAQALEGLTSVVGNNDPASGTALRHGRHLQAVLGRLGDPPEEVAMASLYLGTAHMRMRHWDEAEAHYRRALEVDTGTPRAHRVRLSATANLAAVHGMRGDLAQAREVGGRALELAIARLGPRHPTVASLLHNQGTIATSLGEWHEALDLFERSVAIREATSGRAHPEVGRALQNLGVVLRALGRHEQALAVSLEALEIKQATLGSEGPSVAMAVNNVGDVLLDLNRPAEALQRFEAAIAAWGESNDRIFALIGVAESQSALGRHHLALAAALETLELMKSVPLDARNRGRFRLGAARVLWEAGEIGRAQSLAVQAREDYSEAQGNTQSELHEVEAWLAAHGGG